MSEFIVFAGENFYPSGGMDDYFMCSSNIDKIKRTVEAEGNGLDWCHIVDIPIHKVIVRGKRDTSPSTYPKIEWEWDQGD